MSYDRQCSSCGGFCGRGGCKRENVYSWEQRQRMATPHDQLIAELLDSRIPKTEREHAAAREIKRLLKALAEPEQEPAGTVTGWYGGHLVIEPAGKWIPAVGTVLYAAPPARKPLTDSEVFNMAADYYEGYGFKAAEFARAIERAHGIGVTNEQAT